MKVTPQQRPVMVSTGGKTAPAKTSEESSELVMPPEPLMDLAQVDLERVIADRDAIRQVNKQRYEMEQLDAIVHIDTNNHLVVGYKDVKSDEFWVRGHMPDYPLLPGVLMCEAAAQLCSYYTGRHVQIAGEFMGFGGMEEVRFRAPVRPGDRLVLIARGERVKPRQTKFRVQGFVRQAPVFDAVIIGVALNRPQQG
jgi:3-hydroxyacyl-[acyl-carrier-protein] dehydratase